MAKNPRLVDMRGRTVGLWTVHEQAGNITGGSALWRCVCACGNTATVLGGDLRSGKSRSCGCLNRERLGAQSKRHGESKSRLYQVWKNMRRRCRDKDHHDYGGRGISVCPEWNSYEIFRNWAFNAGYKDNLTIERVEVNGNYSPNNCIWADAQAQSENRRFVAKAPNGRLWWHIARENGITQAAYRTRIYEGWSYQKASTWPMGRRSRDGNLSRVVYLILFGESLPATHAARRLGYSPAALYQRAKRMDATLQDALNEMAKTPRV